MHILKACNTCSSFLRRHCIFKNKRHLHAFNSKAHSLDAFTYLKICIWPFQAKTHSWSAYTHFKNLLYGQKRVLKVYIHVLKYAQVLALVECTLEMHMHILQSCFMCISFLRDHCIFWIKGSCMLLIQKLTL